MAKIRRPQFAAVKDSAKKNAGKKTSKMSSAAVTLMQNAQAAQSAGRLDEALELYQRVLRESENNADAMMYIGLVHYLKRSYSLAREWLNKARQNNVDDGSYFLHSGLINYGEGKLPDALADYEKAVKLLPRQQQAHYNLGLALYKLNRAAEAAAAFAQAHQLAPDDADITYHWACALFDCGEPEKAKNLLEQFTDKCPHQARGWGALGIFYAKQNLTDLAAQHFEKALALEPDNATTHYRYATVLRNMKQHQNAITHFLRAHEIMPDNLGFLIDLGYCYMMAGEYEKANETGQKAATLAPENYLPYILLGYVWSKANLMKSIDYYDQALKINPQAEGEILGFKALAQHFSGRVQDAEKSFLRAIELEPKNPDNYMNFANTLMIQAQIPECLEYLGKTLRLRPQQLYAFSNVLLYSHYIPQATRDDLWSLFNDFNNRYARPVTPNNVNFPNVRDPQKKLRVGFISCDFRTHSVAFFVEPLLRSHQREQFEFFCYSSGTSKDKYTGLLKTYVEHWRDILPLSDEQAVAQIRQDEIDILIDLSGHTADHRLMVFARKAAPVQATWLGYPDTSGITAIDYRIADEYTDPPQYDKMSAEKVVRLPGGFHCYCPFPNAPEIIAQPHQHKDHIAFGSFNNYAKTSIEIASLWVEILNAVPKSKLYLKSLGLSDEQVQIAVRDRFSRLGLSPDRVVILPRTSSIFEHFKLYGEIDIALDTWPYNGTTTTFEALWMGVPIVSLIGTTHASRVGASILSNCDLFDLICQSPEEYVGKAVALAEHHELRAQLRQTMRGRMLCSPLLSEEWFTRKFEVALRAMWREYCGEKDATSYENICAHLPPFISAAERAQTNAQNAQNNHQPFTAPIAPAANLSPNETNEFKVDF